MLNAQNKQLHEVIRKLRFYALIQIPVPFFYCILLTLI
jgi:hypothetical protein